jgi:hypothetical protein
MITPNKDEFVSRMAITFTADRVFGATLSLDQCVAALREFNVYRVIERLVLLLHLNARIFLDGDLPVEQRRNHLGRLVHFMFEQCQLRPV